jgi:OmpA-OmpF porin, OOP family
MHEVGQKYKYMKKIAHFILILMSLASLKAQEQPSKPTKELALIKTTVTNKAKKPLVGDQIFYTSKKNNKRFQGITDKEGKFSILLPIGDTYLVEYKNFTDNVKYKEFAIPAEPALYTMDINISFEPARVIVLKNVEYDFNKSTIRPSSFKSLDDLVEVLTLKPNLVIEIGGHTDNVGDDQSNELLSQRRAESVKQYLVKKGVKPERVQTKGYGESMPVADNDTNEGRQKNRRTEVKIIKE